MNIIFFAFLVFVASFLVLELFLYAFRIIRYPDRPEIKKRLRDLELDVHAPEQSSQDILKRRVLSDVPFLNRVLPAIPGIARLDFMIKQANLKYTLGFFILCAITLGLVGYLLGSFASGNRFLGIFFVPVLGCLPFVYVLIMRKQRMTKFEKQLPDGLGLIARALRAGHAFTSGMKLASDEFEDPLGPEFGETLDEINFGLNVPDALKNLAGRVDCPDLKLFVVSVIMQRETGGNLAEIIENLAGLIRERFKFRSKVRVLSAEGRLSATVLILLPFCVFGLIFLMNPGYLTPLMVEPMGRVLMGLALFMMVLGVLVIRRIINVDV